MCGKTNGKCNFFKKRKEGMGERSQDQSSKEKDVGRRVKGEMSGIA